MTTSSPLWICTECAASLASSSCATHPDDVPVNVAMEQGRFLLAAIEDEKRVALGEEMGRKWATFMAISSVILATVLIVTTGAWFGALVLVASLTWVSYLVGRAAGVSGYTPMFTHWLGNINAEPEPEMEAEVARMRARPGGTSVAQSIVENLLG